MRVAHLLVASRVGRPELLWRDHLDRSLALGRTPFPLPMHFGHECVAEVLAVGEAVATINLGDRVVVPFQISCGRCARCQCGLTATCESMPPMSMYGFGLGGGHWGGVVCDQLAVPYADGMLVPLTAAHDPAAAASVADNVSDAYRHVVPHLPGLLARDAAAELIVVGPAHARTTLSGSVPLYAPA
jgi:alcohol dehydrogenase